MGRPNTAVCCGALRRHTGKYASFFLSSCALHPTIFEQSEKTFESFRNLDTILFELFGNSKHRVNIGIAAVVAPDDRALFFVGQIRPPAVLL
jgi:hypothetical protein